jgi:AraC-like DNA-binding protein
MRPMDALVGFLDGPRARGAFLLRSVFEPPWSLRIEDHAPLTVVAVVHGEAWVVPDDAAAVRLGPGAVAIVRGPDPYVVADNPATAPHVVIHPDQRCAPVGAGGGAYPTDLGVRTWGTGLDGSTTLLCGTYQLQGEISQRLLDALPVMLALPASALDSPIVALLAAEIGRDEPGQEAVLDRLLDLLLVTVLRAWFARPDGDAPAWYRAHQDPVVGGALRLLHDDPAHPWTVAGLATAVGVSRAALARRFTDVVGDPPMAYLTTWRLALAADLLREPDATVTSVARAVGYATPFALSTAFKRVRGVSPRQHRAAAAS